MGAFDEIKGEGLKAILMLGGILGLYVIFLVYTSLGSWALILILLVVLAGFMMFHYMRTGKIW